MSRIIKCKGCNRTPDEIPEYIELAKELNLTPNLAVITEEGTYNHGTGRFYCTNCYITAGMPLGKA